MRLFMKAAPRFAGLVAYLLCTPAVMMAQEAQDILPAGPVYRVSALTGYQWFDESAALRRAPFLGVRVSRDFARFVTAGVHVAVSRPESRGEYFPWNRQVYYSDASHQNDTTLLFQVNQQVTLATYGLDIGAQFGGMGRQNGGRFYNNIALSLSAGAGFFSLWLDPERTRGHNVRGGLSFSLGGGVSVPLGRTTSVGLRLDDVILTNYYRDMLNLSDPLFAEDLFPNPIVKPPPAKTTVHNPRMTVSFSFIPGVRAR